jgi:fructose-bisphosphate aldolase class I
VARAPLVLFAPLDQSGGSRPIALRLYGLSESDYAASDEMFRLVHEMRVRITTAPAFTGRARAFSSGQPHD